ncbi:MAG: MerR family transcriptional regulator [Saprospiraceae bacterium]
MLIGELVKKSGLTKDTIRYYEKVGIFNNRLVQRNPENGYKNYTEEVLEVIKMLKIGKEHGCTLNEIKELIESHHEASLTCFSIAPFIHRKLQKINEEMKHLELQKAKLEMTLLSIQPCLDNEVDGIITYDSYKERFA